MPVAVGYATSSYRDRTSELHAIADSLRRSHAFSQGASSSSSSSAVAAAPNGSSSSFSINIDGSSSSASGRMSQQQAGSAGSVQSEFNKRASRIGLSIHQTSQKLSKLTKLAKRTSMFDDPAAEIQDLTAVIKQDITALNAAISDLQVLCDSRNEGANRTKHSSEHSTTVVDNLKSRLMNTTKEFKDVLTLRTENLKVHENRRQLFTATPPKETNAFARQRPLNSLAPSNGNAPSSSSAANGPSTSSNATNHPWANGATANSQLFSSRRRLNADGLGNPGSQLGQMQQQQQQLMVPGQDSYMQSRAEALQSVESTIVELSNIFTQLATMVAQQGELAIRIDENMDDTLANVEGAQGALLKYLNRISSNRWLIIKIFFVLVIFMLIFVVFVA
ncbi:unnamed protein product [Calypogeia fissa]